MSQLLVKSAVVCLVVFLEFFVLGKRGALRRARIESITSKGHRRTRQGLAGLRPLLCLQFPGPLPEIQAMDTAAQAVPSRVTSGPPPPQEQRRRLTLTAATLDTKLL